MPHHSAEANFGTWLSEVRANADLSRAELAEALGTDRASIRRWEDGAAEPGGWTLLRIALACGLQIDPPLPANFPRPLNAELRLLRRELALLQLVRPGDLDLGPNEIDYDDL